MKAPAGSGPEASITPSPASVHFIASELGQTVYRVVSIAHTGAAGRVQVRQVRLEEATRHSWIESVEHDAEKRAALVAYLLTP